MNGRFTFLPDGGCVPKKVFLRGLIEVSNICRKNCLYCGIRCGNHNVERYELTDRQILSEARFALEAGYGSVVLQGGERCDSNFVERITRLIWEIRHLEASAGAPSAYTAAPLGITLSLGEQSREVYNEWKKAGAHRYLLRIEASNRELYGKIHPSGSIGESQMHSYDSRMAALCDLKSTGFITGSGVMIGLPFQTPENLDEDLAFFKKFGVDMVGMGPYIPHKDTPLGRMVLEAQAKGTMVVKDTNGNDVDLGPFALMSDKDKLDLSIDMVRRLRRLMPHINIAATTALQVLDPNGREMAVLAGANVIMPNITEREARDNYQLYEGKPGVNDDAISTKESLERNLKGIGVDIAWGEVGDPYVV